MLHGQGQRIAVTCRQQAGRPLTLGALDRSDRMNHTARRQTTTRSDDGLPGRQAVGVGHPPNLLAGGQNVGTAGPVDGAVHPASAQQAGVGGVHNRIDPAAG